MFFLVLKNWYNKILFGKNINSPLERRIFILITFLTVIIAFIGNLSNIILGFDFLLILITAIATGITFYIFLMARTVQNHERYTFFLFIASIIILSIVFILSDGYNGNTINLFFVYFIGIYVIIPEKSKFIVFLIYTITLGSLILLQEFYPSIITPYTNRMQRFIDLFVGNILYMILLYNLVSIIIKNYIAEHNNVSIINNQLNVLNEELNNKNIEIIKSNKLVQENEERLRLILESTNDGLWDWDIRQDRSYFSARYYTMLGYEPNEFPASYTMWKSLVHPDDLNNADKIIEKESSHTNGYYVTEFRMKAKNGEWRWILNRGKVVERDSEGKILRMVGVHMDITDKKIAEEKLIASEERYRTLISASPDGISMMDLSGKIKFMSEKALNMHGYSSRYDILNLSIFELFEAEDRERAKNDFNNFILTGEKAANTRHYKLLKKNGEIFFGQINLDIIKDYTGKPQGIISVTRDITDKLKLEEQLQMRQRMDSIGTLAGGIAHDFNNLLTGIIGYLSLLDKAKNLDSNQKRQISNALQAGKRASDLTRQLQSLSKTDIPDMSAIDIAFVAEEVFDFLDKTTEKSITKKVDIQRGEFFVFGNITELHQVFLNLGTNSIQAIEERGFEKGDYIRISAENYSALENDLTGLEKGEYVHILFEDNGIGMTDDTIRKAFDPLFTTKSKGREHRGQGLGLAMVYNIITGKHKGNIEIQSKYEVGTTIHIYLPRTASENRYDSESNLDDNNADYSGSENILIIDDEDFILDVAQSILESIGYTVYIARSGLEGIKIFNDKRKHIDLVILDLTMPNMNGSEVLKELLKIDPDVNVLICSGHSFEAAENRETVLSKAKGFIRKPYKTNDLARKVRNVLDSINKS